MGKTIFEEKQRFNQWAIWLGIAIIASIMIYQLLTQDEMYKSFFSFITLLIVVLLILSINLKTRIDEHGIHVKMFPFHLSTVSYLWSDLYSAEVTQYSPIGDYGGWGVRLSLRGKGKAFNVRGNIGIKIQTADGKTRMIGTQKKDEAKRVIENFKSKMA